METALRALQSTAVLISEVENSSALCDHRPPFGLLDAGAKSLVGHLNASRRAACLILAQQLAASNRRKVNARKETCAVVGSGGAMRFSSQGREIDRHASIIRFNGAPTLALYRQDVGMRTTLQLSTLVPWRHWRRRVDAARLAKTRDNVLYCHNHWVGNCWQDALRHGDGNVINPMLVGRLSTLLLQHSSRKASRVPSTGLVGVAIALASCSNAPDVFGFGNESERAVCDHYWECRTDQASYLGRPTHSFRAQSSLLRWLSDQRAIRLHGAPRKGTLAFTMPPERRRANV